LQLLGDRHVQRIVSILTGLVVAVVVAFLAYRWFAREEPPAKALLETAPAMMDALVAPESAPTEPPSPAPVAAPPPIEHPVTPAPSDATPLPPLADSDEPLLTAVSSVAERTALAGAFDLDDIVRKFVVTVDNLPGGKVRVQNRLAKPVPGTLAVRADGEHFVLDRANFDRYQPLLALLTGIDPIQLAAVYRHFYPLFQQAYADLGYPQQYFNDRLVAVIDHVLAAPAPPPTIELVQPKVFYRFADPALESQSPAHKILLRIGPDNAAALQAWLRRLRGVLARPGD
jgi:hypothetical protein